MLCVAILKVFTSREMTIQTHGVQQMGNIHATCTAINTEVWGDLLLHSAFNPLHEKNGNISFWLIRLVYSFDICWSPVVDAELPESPRSWLVLDPWYPWCLRHC